MKSLVLISICLMSLGVFAQEEEFIAIEVEGKEAFMSTKTGEYTYRAHAETDATQLKTTASGVIYTNITEHIIKKGETLSGIARKNGVSLAELKEHNKVSSSNLKIGNTIKIVKKEIVKSSSPVLSYAGEERIIARLAPGQSPGAVAPPPPVSEVEKVVQKEGKTRKNPTPKTYSTGKTFSKPMIGVNTNTVKKEETSIEETEKKVKRELEVAKVETKEKVKEEVVIETVEVEEEIVEETTAQKAKRLVKEVKTSTVEESKKIEEEVEEEVVEESTATKAKRLVEKVKETNAEEKTKTREELKAELRKELEEELKAEALAKAKKELEAEAKKEEGESNKEKEEEEKAVEKEEDVSEEEGKFYTVKKGDTLWGISKANNVSVEKIKKLNNLKTNNLDIGQKLKLN